MADPNRQIDGADSNLEKSWIEGVETHGPPIKNPSHSEWTPSQ